MAYTPREIKDRVAVGDDIFIVEDLGNNRIRLIPAPTHVSEAGTPVNKALLQPIEDELGNLSATKVDKVSGKDLSTNDFTNALKNKLDGIEAGAQVNPGVATTSANGLMSSADKTKLNGLNIKTGTYQGAGSGSLDIPLGFTPTIVIILNLRRDRIAYRSPAYTSGYRFIIWKRLGYGHEMKPIYGLDAELRTDNDFLINGQTLTVSGMLYENLDTYAYIAL